MPSATISNLGFSSQFAPQIKRATATLSDGSVVMMVPDTNIAAFAGDDTGAKATVRFYKSDTTRTVWTLNFTWTPAAGVDLSSATLPAVLSMVLDSSNNIHLAFTTITNELCYIPFTFGSGTWTGGSRQVIQSTNAVTRRHRAIDIDVTSTNRPAIIVYESKASAGPSAWTRVYIRNDDGTTWRKAHEYDHASGAGGNINIYDGSEDVSISWNSAGITSNVGQLLIYYTRVGFFYDHGDTIAELQYNVNTGTDNSATVLGTWPKFNQDIAAGTRRAWLFKTTSNLWQVAMVMGSANPVFVAGRLTHGAYSAPGMDRTTVNVAYQTVDLNGVPRRITPMQPQINYTVNKMNTVGCVYADNRVMFGYITANSNLNGVTQFGASATVFRYPDASNYSANYIDTQMRPLDNNFSYGELPIGVYGGGNNRNQAGDLKFNFMVLYGYTGNTASSARRNIMRAVIDTFYDPPTNVAPALSVNNDAPTLQARVQNTALYPNIRGKVEFNLARDSGFSTDLRSIIEPDANYRYLGSTTSAVPPPVNISLALSGVGSQKLYSGTWYMRSRVVSDLGQASSWSSTTQFAVSHAPSALTRSPNAGSLITFGSSGNITFTWQMSDTEPTDVQSAYRLLVQRLDTGTSVVDTGKIISTVNSATSTLSNTLLDVPLQWSVSLWDSDDVQGPFSNPVPFTVSQPPTVRVTTPTDGATVTSAAPAVGWSTTFSGSRTQKAYKVSTIVANTLSLFAGTVSSAWANTADGEVWTFDGGSNTDYSEASGVGVMSLGSVNVARKMILAATNVLNSTQHALMNISVLATGAPIQMGLISRYVDASNYHRAVIEVQTDNSMMLRIVSRVATVEVNVASIALTGLTYVANTNYNLLFQTSDTNYYAKAWVSGGNQPGYWQASGTITSLPSPGQRGTYARLNTSNTNTLPVLSRFDLYSSYDGNNPLVTGTSNWIQDTATAYSFAANVLQNSSYYLVKVDVMDTAGMLGSDAVQVITAWTAPTDGVSSVTTDEYGATISWTNSGIDVTFIAWRVYRRYMVPASVDLDDENTRNTWVLVYETDAVQANYSYKDYLTPNNKATDYVIVQVADRFGSVVESPVSAFSTVTVVGNRYYFIPTVPVGTIAAYQASNVTDDSYVDEVESETLHVIGRGRQVQVGDDLGVTGTLTIQLRGANTRVDREFLQKLASSKNLGTWMKNPFGDVRLVKFGNIQVKPLSGTGTTEMSDLTIPYTEVISDVPITRL